MQSGFGNRYLEEPLLTVPQDTDTATPRRPIPIYFIHTLQVPFCRNARCACRTSIRSVTRLLKEVAEGIVVLDQVDTFLEPPQPVRKVDVEVIDGLPLDCHLYGHSWEPGICPGEKICTLCGMHGYCPLCTLLPLPHAQPFTCTRHAQHRQVQ